MVCTVLTMFPSCHDRCYLLSTPASHSQGPLSQARMHAPLQIQPVPHRCLVGPLMWLSLWCNLTVQPQDPITDVPGRPGRSCSAPWCRDGVASAYFPETVPMAQPGPGEEGVDVYVYLGAVLLENTAWVWRRGREMG